MNTNTKVTINQMVFRNLYFRYRDFVTPLSVIVVSLLLLWFLVVPEIQNYLAMQDTISVDRQKLQIMHQNLSLVTGLDDAKLTTMLTTATSALPTDKDFAGIIASIQNAAAVAGADLGDYSFSLGDLSGLNTQGKPTNEPLQLSISLRGDIASAERFTTQLEQQLPLADTAALVVNANQSITVTVVFYYAQLPKIVFQDGSPLPVLGSADQQLLDSLASGNNLQNAVLSTPAATPSATPTLTVTPTIVTPTPPVATTSAATSSAF